MGGEVKEATVTWKGGMRFEGGLTGGPAAVTDADGIVAPSPMVTLLLAIAGCSGADVALILGKMRVELRELRMEVTGTRREAEPRRYVALHLTYYLAGEGLDEAKARRAIDLSIEKYCSVIHSLAPDIPITYDLRLG